MPSDNDGKKFTESLVKYFAKRGEEAMEIKDNDVHTAFKKSATREMGEDLNILPLPTHQSFALGERIVWDWVTDIGTVSVHMTLKDNVYKAGHFEIRISDNGGLCHVEPKNAKAFGQALISASNWHNVWREHVGVLIERDMMLLAGDD